MEVTNSFEIQHEKYVERIAEDVSILCPFCVLSTIGDILEGKHTKMSQLDRHFLKKKVVI